ncbi:MAG: isoprenylcysteine carboxylmethyltransferase family protein [Salinibacter sp.]
MSTPSPPDDVSSADGPEGEAPPGTILAPSPLLTLAAFLVGVLIERVWPSTLLPWPWTLPVGLVLVGGGAGLFGGAIWTMRSHNKHPAHSDEPPDLITDGPFRISRNPIYVGHSLVHVGASFLIDSVWPLVTLVPLGVYLRRVVRREEKRLSALFGDEYDRYRRRVRRWL